MNPRSGGGKVNRFGLVKRAEQLGAQVAVTSADQGAATLARLAVEQGATVLGVAGGDGTVSAVAAVAAGTHRPLVVVPAGTRNHFARDLGLDPDDLVGALDAFTDALEASIDLGDVNSRPFLNNVSLGVYGTAVQRDSYPDAKARTLLETVAEVLGPSAALPGVRLVDDFGVVHSDPALILVSNNPYGMNLPGRTGMRPVLDSGQLGVLVLSRPGGASRRPGHEWTTRSLDVTAGDVVTAGLDGEAVRLDPTVHFAIRPRALRVRIARAL